MVEIPDVDYSDIENLEENLDVMYEKIECSDLYIVQNLFIPIMHVLENLRSRANLQTFFLMEKVLVNLPNDTKTHPKEIILVYDSGSGRTVGNYIEYLDQFKVQQFRNLVLSREEAIGLI